MKREGIQQKLLGDGDRVTGYVLFFLFSVTKRFKRGKGQEIASHTICFSLYISTEIYEVQCYQVPYPFPSIAKSVSTANQLSANRTKPIDNK